MSANLVKKHMCRLSEQISQEVTHDQLVFDMDYIFAMLTSLFSRRKTIHTFKTNTPHKNSE